MDPVQKILLSKNRLSVTINATKNGIPVNGLIPKTFLSGNFDAIKDVLAKTGNTFTEPRDAKSFAAFVLREVDDIGRFRQFSAEKKWLFDFLENEYELGDHFEITITSLLAPGVTDQRSLLSLQNLAKSDGKVVKLKCNFHHDAFDIRHLRNIIKKT